MVAEMEKLISEIEYLDEDQQKQLANLIQQEMIWQNSFLNTQSDLLKFAAEALNEYKKGNVIENDW